MGPYLRAQRAFDAARKEVDKKLAELKEVLEAN
jgi:hypothetical protein